MKKDSFIKDALVLTAITLISGLLLGAVYGVTKDTIAEAIRQKTNAAYKVVLDAYDYDTESLKAMQVFPRQSLQRTSPEIRWDMSLKARLQATAVRLWL